MIDRRVFDEADMIRAELINEYVSGGSGSGSGGAIPDEVAEAGAAVAEKLQLLGWTGL